MPRIKGITVHAGRRVEDPSRYNLNRTFGITLVGEPDPNESIEQAALALQIQAEDFVNRQADYFIKKLQTKGVESKARAAKKEKKDGRQ